MATGTSSTGSTSHDEPNDDKLIHDEMIDDEIASLATTVRSSRSQSPDGEDPTIFLRHKYHKHGSWKPRAVPIGPYYVEEDIRSPQLIRQLKLECVNYLTRSLTQPHQLEGFLRGCSRELRNLEDRARRTYSDTTYMPSYHFVKMLLFDSCFIVAATCTFRSDPIPVAPAVASNPDRVEPHPPTQTTNPLVRLRFDFQSVMIQDMQLLLVNQIPFFVIENVWNWLKDARCVTSESDYKAMATGFLGVSEEDNRTINGEPYHFVHLIHQHITLGRNSAPEESDMNIPCATELQMVEVRPQDKNIPSATDHQTVEGRSRGMNVPSAAELQMAGVSFEAMNIPSATELQTAGVRFEAMMEPTRRTLDVDFRNGVFRIQTMVDNDYNRILLENLMDFEQFMGGTSYDVTMYVNMMSCLLRKARDVRLLHDKRILRPAGRTDEEVCAYFGELYRKPRRLGNHTRYGRVFAQVNAYHESKQNRWMAILKENYFSNPWVILAVVASIALLILTFLQTFYTVYAYHNPADQ